MTLFRASITRPGKISVPRGEAAEYALYRVRRIYKGPGKADRAVQKLKTGSRAEMAACFERMSSGRAQSVKIRALSAIGLFVLCLINQENKADADSVIRISAHIANHNISRVFSVLR